MDAKDQKKKRAKPLDRGSIQNPRLKKPEEHGLELLKVTRESYRAPVDPSNPVTVQIGTRKYDAVNIAKRGIGFLVAKPDLFFQNEELTSVILICRGNEIALEGKVVHISPYEFGKFICGVEFIRLDKKTDLRLKEYLEKCRLDLFPK
ncbi:MAG: PilZ domain-containing protein [Pseudomonadota bacterium]